MQQSAGTLPDSVGLLAISSVAVCLVPAGAHLFELVNKMGLPPAQYMTVQSIYAGWSLFGIAIAAALVLTALHAWIVRRHGVSLRLSMAALGCLLASQVVFWTFTYPMNRASGDWTRVPDGFEVARRQWEYSHAANATITLLAFLAITLSALLYRRYRDQGIGALPPPRA